MEVIWEESKSWFSDVNKHIIKDTWVMEQFPGKDQHGYKWFWLVKRPDGIALHITRS